MKKWISLLLLAVLLTASTGAMAAFKINYTIPLKGTVLQNLPDRDIQPKTPAVRHKAISGESSVTGLPWEGEYLPMLVQISNATNSVTVKGRTVKSAGLGRGAPWGGQYADIVFEELLYAGFTRFAFLFSDSFADGQPEKGVGPVRSARFGSLLIREEFQSGFVYSGHVVGTFQELAREVGANNGDVLFDLRTGGFTEYKYRVNVKGVKAPDNHNADIIGMRGLISASNAARPRPFLFADTYPYGSGYPAARAIHLDWGQMDTISHFQYDETQNVYLRFCGSGTNPAKWAPFMSFAAVDDRSEENRQPFSFANLIIQRTEYDYPNDNQLVPEIKAIGQGNADIFIGGRYIPGYWVRTSIEEPTVFYDDQGNELRLARGKTFIAHFPSESLLTFAEE